MAHAPVITQLGGIGNDPPYVEVLFNSFAVGTQTVTVFRLADGREYKVRDAIAAATAGSLTRLDYELPPMIPVTYRAQMFDADGLPLGFTDTATVTVNNTDTWVHNPLDPSTSIRVRFTDEAASVLRRPTPGETFWPEGRTVGVLISGQRQGLRGVNLSFTTETFADADKFQAMLGAYDSRTVPVLCFRTPPPMRIPRPLFAAVDDAGELDVAVPYGFEELDWAIAADEVAPPTPALVVPLLTNADLNAFYATNAALNSDNLTGLAVNRRYDLAGTA
jgi:hypothetical protein